jgi:hypothetical protein
MKIVVANDEFLAALREIKKNAEPGTSGEMAEFEFEESSGSLSILFGGAGRIIKAVGSWPHRLKIDRLKAEALCDVLPEENPLELKIIPDNCLQIGKSLAIKCKPKCEDESCERIDKKSLFATLTLEELSNSGTYQREFLVFMEDVHAALSTLAKYGVDWHGLLEVIGKSLGCGDKDDGKERVVELRKCFAFYRNFLLKKDRSTSAEKNE